MQNFQSSARDWLIGGGEMGQLIRSKDWSKTPLGPLRLDFAHALNPPGDADTTFFHFSIGQAF